MSSRRDFLKHSGVAAIAATQLGLMGNTVHANAGSDYCAMVCILLAGGADSFNMLVPTDEDRYAEYANTRADLALSRTEILPLNYGASGGAQYGVHPGLSEVQSLFNNGDLAFMANIGPLAAPTSRQQIDTGTAELPLGLFSHADQIAVWQTATAGIRGTTGFGGRLGDLIAASTPAGPVSMNISMSGTNLFQTGDSITGYAIDPTEGVRNVAGYGDANNEIFTQALDQLLAQDYADRFRRSYAERIRNAIDSGQTVRSALEAAPVLSSTFSANPLSAALAQIARIISVRDLLGATRQTFFVTVGGWDHHDEVLNNQAQMLPGISQGLAEFHAALTELGMLNNVTTFTISDFGRTLTSNGKGSDHGWGGNSLVMGGSVNGGQIYGDYPDLALGTELDLGRGRFLPTTSIDEFYAELALWFGVEASDLSLVLPNIGRFYSSGSGLPLGFMR